MVTRVLTLDVYLNAPNVTHDNFRSPATIFEYDVVFWDPANTLETYQFALGDRYYKGDPRIADHETNNLAQDLIRRRNEFKEFLEMGRTLVIFAAPEQNFWYDTGRRDKSGTGRNQKVTTIVDQMDFMEAAIPVKFRVAAAEGTRISARQSSFRSLLSGAPDRWWYRAILEEYPGEPLAVVTGTSKCVGSVERYEDGGMLLLLPDLQGPDHPSNSEGIEELDNDESPIPIEELAEGSESDVGVDEASLELIAWVESLRMKNDEAPPAWLQRYQFSEDVESSQKIIELEAKKSEIISEIESLAEGREISDAWKRLLYATGDELESQVIEAFRILGFKAERGPEGRADIVVHLDAKRAVVEVKGLGGSAAEKNAAQLEKWVSEEMLSGSGHVKGILVVNSHRHIPPEERNNPAFPHQMVTFSTAREHCLVTTVQLLSMVRAVTEDPSRAPSIGESLLNITGFVPGWEDVTSLFMARKS
ncbi:PD-(D/E)XK nuclease family protein [Streptomyces rubiginosohelvolus]|uniref:hypothetical protein n=1 Tax=Streptomyces rubiginosohelvolus TaxID=67362 RepID=UPI003691DA42